MRDGGVGDERVGGIKGAESFLGLDTRTCHDDVVALGRVVARANLDGKRFECTGKVIPRCAGGKTGRGLLGRNIPITKPDFDQAA